MKKQSRKVNRIKNKVIGILGVVVAVLTYVISSLQKSDPHTSIYGSQPLLGSKSAEIQEVLVQESRKTQDLIVYEQDLKAETKIEDKFLGWDIFKKAQEMIVYGTAEYTVDLSKISKNSIQVVTEDNTVVVEIPHASLKNVTVDFSKTEFSEIDRGFLGWGSLKLTPEEQSAVEQSLHKTMVAEAEKQTYLDKADASATESLSEFYTKLLSQFDEIDPKVKVVLK